MSSTTPRHHDAATRSGLADPSESLSAALQTVARDAGFDIDRDDLNAALGLSWSVTAVPSEDDLALWSMYARDAFLLEAGQLFGMTIRAIHPPEAARGLRGVAEFAQHFDASYRPLILRALEHSQPVLAWQGWPEERCMMWGIITSRCDEGVGFAGDVPVLLSSDGEAAGRTSHHRLTLESPPVQLYVVETIAPTIPGPQKLLDIALQHAARILNNALADRFGVMTGPPAYDAWTERMGDSAAEPESNLAEQHRRLVDSVVAMHRSTARFLGRQCAETAEPVGALIADLLGVNEDIIRVLSEATGSGRAGEANAKHNPQRRLGGLLDRSRELTVVLCDTLNAASRTSHEDTIPDS